MKKIFISMLIIFCLNLFYVYSQPDIKNNTKIKGKSGQIRKIPNNTKKIIENMRNIRKSEREGKITKEQAKLKINEERKKLKQSLIQYRKDLSKQKKVKKYKKN